MRLVCRLIAIPFLFVATLPALGEEEALPPAAAETEPAETLFPAAIEAALGIRGVPVVHLLGTPPTSVFTAMGLTTGDLIVSLNGRGLAGHGGFHPFVAALRRECAARTAVLDVFRHDPGDGSYYLDRISAETLEGSPEGDSPDVRFTSTFNFLVVEVGQASLAEAVGIRPGDFIQEINRVQIPDLSGPAEMEDLVARFAARPGDEWEIRFGRWEHLDDHGRMRGYFFTGRGTL